MKTKTLILSMLAVTIIGQLVTAKTQLTQTPLKKQSEILFDFRLARTNAPLKISPATHRSVLSKVFRRYLTDESQCNPQFEGDDQDRLKAARNAGQVVPQITDMATGSFTGPGKSETIYVISSGECNASHAENFGTKRVAIFSGQQMIANVDIDFRNSILRKTDLNDDGINELLMTTGDMNQGVIFEAAALVDFQKGRVRVIEDFGTVVEDSCASGVPGSSSRASVISMSGGGLGTMPRLRMANYETGCRKVKRWRLVSTGKMTG